MDTETAAQQNGTVILEGEYSDTSLQMEAFAAAVLNGSAYPGMLREAYHATVAALLGEQAMDSGQAVTWPRDYIMPNKSESPKSQVAGKKMKKSFVKPCGSFFMSLSLASAGAFAADWQPLFNGKGTSPAGSS